MLRDTPALGLGTHLNATETVTLVRRRSGGGTVFHDYGNLNYCVICPAASFTRDKHAEMVTQAIRTLTPRARVNERHDIVLDQGTYEEDNQIGGEDLHHTPYQPPTLKVSGSAYKLTRQRALHHGTCLLCSPNIKSISGYLQSPARPFMKARGVESVRSPIGNILDKGVNDGKASSNDFQIRVMQAFANMYQVDQNVFDDSFNGEYATSMSPSSDCAVGYLADDVTSIAEIERGIAELQSPQWIYGQTPRFTLSSHSCEEDDRARPALPDEFPASGRIQLVVKSGIITSSRITLSSSNEIALAQVEHFNKVLEGKSVQDIQRFEELLGTADHPRKTKEMSAMSNWLDFMFGKAAE